MSELILAILAGLLILDVVIEKVRNRRERRIYDIERRRQHAALMRDLRRHG